MGDGRDQVGALAVQPGPAAARAQRDGHLLDRLVQRRPVEPRRDQHLGAVGQQPGLLGDRGPGGQARRRAGCRRPTPLPSWSVSASTTSSGCPTGSPVDAEHPDRGRRDQRDPTVARRRPPRRRAARRRPPARRTRTRPRRHAWQQRWRARLVEAQRGGGGQVEALGAAVDRDRDPVVGERGEVVRQAVRLVAEQPGRRAVEQVAGVVEDDLAVAVGGEHREPGGRGARRPRRRVGSTATGRWNRLPTLARTVLGL